MGAMEGLYYAKITGPTQGCKLGFLGEGEVVLFWDSNSLVMLNVGWGDGDCRGTGAWRVFRDGGGSLLLVSFFFSTLCSFTATIHTSYDYIT